MVSSEAWILSLTISSPHKPLGIGERVCLRSSPGLVSCSEWGDSFVNTALGINWTQLFLSELRTGGQHTVLWPLWHYNLTSVLVLRVYFLNVHCHIVFLWNELVTAWQKLCPQRNTMWPRLSSWLILPTGNDTYTEVPMCGIRAQHFMLDMILVSTCMYSVLGITYKEKYLFTLSEWFLHACVPDTMH